MAIGDFYTISGSNGSTLVDVDGVYSYFKTVGGNSIYSITIGGVVYYICPRSNRVCVSSSYQYPGILGFMVYVSDASYVDGEPGDSCVWADGLMFPVAGICGTFLSPSPSPSPSISPSPFSPSISLSPSISPSPSPNLIQIVDMEFRPGGFGIVFSNDDCATAFYQMTNGVLSLDGLRPWQQSALSAFNRNIDASVTSYDPRFNWASPPLFCVRDDFTPQLGGYLDLASFTITTSASTGDYSIDLQLTRQNNSQSASGDYSTILGGRNNTANGLLTAIASGDAVIASGQFSHAEGSLTSAIGSRSHAEGFTTIASGDKSHAQGNSTLLLELFLAQRVV